jgi:hypothetical protein
MGIVYICHKSLKTLSGIKTLTLPQTALPIFHVGKTRYDELELAFPKRLLIKSSESLIKWRLFFDGEFRAAAQSNLLAASL